jgi:cyclase
MKRSSLLFLLSASLLFGQQPPFRAIDFSGMWTAPLHEDFLERGAGPEIADYAGFPINEAGRLWALSYNASRVTLRHHQCDGYTAAYQVRAVGNSRAWEERDPNTQRLIAIHWWHQTFEGHRTIWMDGRPHPPAWAPHSWMGFSTGRFVGNALEVTTTHLKQGYTRRNGSPQSDQATLIEFYVRHGDHVTYTSVLNDPVFLSEPLLRTTDFYRQPADPGSWLFACDDGEQILTKDPANVPNYLPGQNPFIREFSDRHKVPLFAAMGGPESMYPEFAAKARSATDAQAIALTRPSPGPRQTSKAANPEPTDGEIHVFPIRQNLSMLVGDGGNIVVQTGDQGTLVVDSGAGRITDKVIAAIRRLSDKPIQFLVNTSYRPDHTGGNARLRATGLDPSVQGSFFSNQFADAGRGATIMSQQNVQDRIAGPVDGVPSDTYLEERRRKFHNGDSVELFYQPNAVTDGDSLIHFRRADVIVTGEIFNTTQYPLIDTKAGGTLQGVINALNDILNRTVYQHEGEGGTLIVPGHGYLSDEHEVVEYRDMLAIIRDRVQAMIKAGATLDQVQAAGVTADYDTRFGANTGPWTTAMFVEAAYSSLKK